MNANESRNTRTDSTPLLFKDEVFRIVGCAMEVLNALGHGLHEKPYENALVVEFGLSSIPFLQQSHHEVLYKQVKVGEYVPDLIAFGVIVVDAKGVEAITDHERGQMLNYLKITRAKARCDPKLQKSPARVGADHPAKGSCNSQGRITLALIRVHSRWGINR